MNKWLIKHSLVRRAVSVISLIAFTTCFVLADARAAVENAPEHRFAPLSVRTFTLPGHLGEIRDVFQGGKDRLVIHIQDAHCNPQAQHRIADIIDYLNKEYGIRTVNLEGGAGDYDLDVFTAITGEEIRREVADYFVKKGEINGAEFYAINNPDKVMLWGVEDKDLYMANLKVYRDSLSYSGRVEDHLKKLTYIYNNLKRHIYTPALLEMDLAYNAYKADNMDFREYVEFMTTKAAERGVQLKDFPNIQLLAGSLSMENGIDFKKANVERNTLIEELKKNFSTNETRELVSRTVEFKTKRISPREFYGYLLAKAEEVEIDIGEFPALAGYVVYVARYEEVDSSLLPAELDEIDAAIKEKLYSNDEQKRLNILSRNLALMKNIFAIRLIKTDYEYYLANKVSFEAANFTSFIEEEAPKYGIKERPDVGITELDACLGEITEFYEYSFRRDEAFLENLRFDTPSGSTESAVLMTGGFHAENLWSLMKAEDISYVSIVPKFTSGMDQESPYFSLLAGQMTDVQRMLRSALSVQAAMMQVASMLSSGLARSVWDAEGIKAFYSEVRLREILSAGAKDAQTGGCTVTVWDNGEKKLSVAEGDSPENNNIDVELSQILEWAQDIYIDTQIRDIMEGRTGSYEVLDSSHPAVQEASDFFSDAIASLRELGDAEALAGAEQLEKVLNTLREVSNPAGQITSASGDPVQLVLLTEGASGFRGHAGGRGIYVNGAEAGSTRELAAILVHEAMAAYARSDDASVSVEQMFRAERGAEGQAIADVMAGSLMRDGPVWDIAKADRWKGGRDVAAVADIKPAIRPVAPDAEGRNFYVTTGMLTRDELNDRVDLIRNSDFLERLKTFLPKAIQDKFLYISESPDMEVLRDLDIIFNGEQASADNPRPIIKSVIVYGSFLYGHTDRYDGDLDVEVEIDWGPELLGDFMRHQHDIERFSSINFHNANAMTGFQLQSRGGKRTASRGADIYINTGSVDADEDVHLAQMRGVGIPVFGEDRYAPSLFDPDLIGPAQAEQDIRLLKLSNNLMDRGWELIQRAKEARDDIDILNKQIRRGYADMEKFGEIAELEEKEKTNIKKAFKRYLESVVVMSFIAGFQAKEKMPRQLRVFIQSQREGEIDKTQLDRVKGAAEMLRKEVEVITRERAGQETRGENGADAATFGKSSRKLTAVASWFDDPLWAKNAWRSETIWSFAPLAGLLLESMFLAPVLQMIVPFVAAAIPAAIFLGLHIDRTLSFKQHVSPRSVAILSAVKLGVGGISAALSLINIPLALGALVVMSVGTAFLHRYLSPYGEGENRLDETPDEEVTPTVIEESEVSGAYPAGQVSNDPAATETVTAIASDGGEIAITLDAGGVLEDVIRFGDEHGMRVQFAAGISRRMLMGKNPVLLGADVDLVVFPKERIILPNGKREARENMAARVATFQRELGGKYPGIEVDVMNVSDDEIGSSYMLVEDSRVLTMDRMIIEKVGGVWQVTDETGGSETYLRNAREKRFQLTPRTGNKKRPAYDGNEEKTGEIIDGPFLSYESALRFARVMAEFPESEVDMASLEEVKAFVATGFDQEGRPFLTIQGMLEDFAKGDADMLMRAMSPPIKSLVKVFIHAKDPDSVIDVFKSIGTEKNNLYTLFSTVVDLDVLPGIVKGSWARTGDMSVFDEAFFSRNTDLRENPYVQRYTVDSLTEFLKGRVRGDRFSGSAEELSAMRRFIAAEHADWIEKTNGMDMGRRGGRRYALVELWSNVMLSENISLVWFLGLRHYIPKEFFEHVRTDFVNITGRIKSGEFRNLLDYYVKEYDAPAQTTAYTLGFEVPEAMEAIVSDPALEVAYGIYVVACQALNRRDIEEADSMVDLLRDAAITGRAEAGIGVDAETSGYIYDIFLTMAGSEFGYTGIKDPFDGYSNIADFLRSTFAERGHRYYFAQIINLLDREIASRKEEAAYSGYGDEAVLFWTGRKSVEDVVRVLKDGKVNGGEFLDGIWMSFMELGTDAGGERVVTKKGRWSDYTNYTTVYPAKIGFRKRALSGNGLGLYSGELLLDRNPATGFLDPTSRVRSLPLDGLAEIVFYSEEDRDAFLGRLAEEGLKLPAGVSIFVDQNPGVKHTPTVAPTEIEDEGGISDDDAMASLLKKVMSEEGPAIRPWQNMMAATVPFILAIALCKFDIISIAVAFGIAVFAGFPLVLQSRKALQLVAYESKAASPDQGYTIIRRNFGSFLAPFVFIHERVHLLTAKLGLKPGGMLDEAIAYTLELSAWPIALFYTLPLGIGEDLRWKLQGGKDWRSPKLENDGSRIDEDGDEDAITWSVKGYISNGLWDGEFYGRKLSLNLTLFLRKPDKVDDLIRLGLSVSEGSDSRRVGIPLTEMFGHGLASLLDSFGERFIKKNWDEIVRLGLEAGPDAGTLFRYVLPAAAESIIVRNRLGLPDNTATKRNLSDIGETCLSVIKAMRETNAMAAAACLPVLASAIAGSGRSVEEVKSNLMTIGGVLAAEGEGVSGARTVLFEQMDIFSEAFPPGADISVTADTLRRVINSLANLKGARSGYARQLYNRILSVYRDEVVAVSEEGVDVDATIRNIETLATIVQRVLGDADSKTTDFLIRSIITSLRQEIVVENNGEIGEAATEERFRVYTDFVTTEKNATLFEAKKNLIDTVLLMRMREFFGYIRSSYEGVQRKDQLAYLRGLNNILKNGGMLKEDSIDDWKTLLEGYIPRFGFLADRDLILAHRYLVSGEALNGRRLKKYALKGLNVSDTGERGVEQLSEVFRSVSQGLLDSGSIDARYVRHPIVAAMVGRMTGFNTAVWGHGSKHRMKLVDFVRRFYRRRTPILARKVEAGMEKAVADGKASFVVRQNARADLTPNEKVIFEKYRRLSSVASDALSRRNIVEHFKDMAQARIDIIRAELEARLASAPDEMAKIGITQSIKRLKKAGTAITMAETLVDLNIALMRSAGNLVKNDREPEGGDESGLTLQGVVIASLFAEAFRQSPELKTKLNGVLTEGVTRSVFAGALSEFRDISLKEHILKGVPKSDIKNILKTFSVPDITEAAGTEGETTKVTAFITKGILGEMAGDIGDACYTAVQDLMGQGSMVGAVIFTTGEGMDREPAGSMLILENSINGEKTWILRAINPSDKLVSQYSAEEFLKGMLEYVEVVAKTAGVKHIVAPVGVRGALSNRGQIADKDVIEKFTAGEKVTLDKWENLNGYSLKENACVHIYSDPAKDGAASEIDGSALNEGLRGYLRNNAGLLAGDAVVDMGCSHGDTAKMLLEAEPGIKLHAVDTDTGMVERAKVNLKDVLAPENVIKADLFDYPQAGKYDLIVFAPPVLNGDAGDVKQGMSVDAEFDIISRFMEQARQHLTPGGRIVLVYGYEDNAPAHTSDQARGNQRTLEKLAGNNGLSVNCVEKYPELYYGIYEITAGETGAAVVSEENRRAFESEFAGMSDEVLRFLAGSDDVGAEDIISYRRGADPVWNRQGRTTYEHNVTIMSAGAPEAITFYTKRQRMEIAELQEALRVEARVASVAGTNDLSAKVEAFAEGEDKVVMVSPRVKGSPLRDPVTLGDLELPVSAEEAAGHIAHSLGRLHGTGIVHGDLTFDVGDLPSLGKTHVFIDVDGTARFIDFGDATYDPSLSSEDFILRRDAEAANVILALSQEFGVGEQDLMREYRKGSGTTDDNDTPEITGNVSAGLRKAEERRWRQRIKRDSNKVKAENPREVAEVVQACRRMRDMVAEVSEMYMPLRAVIRDALKKQGIRIGVQEGVLEAIFSGLRDPGSPVLAALASPEDNFEWFNARVDGDKKYLLGHESAIAVNVVKHLREWEKKTGATGLVEEYVLHEALENIDIPGLTPLEKHHVIIEVTNTIVRDRGDFERPLETPLGLALRTFITKAVFEKEVEKLKESGVGDDGFAAAYTALIDRTVERMCAYLGMGDLVTVIAMGSYARRATPYGTDVDMLLLVEEESRRANNMAEKFVIAAETVLGTTLDFPVYPVDPGPNGGSYCLTTGKLEKQYRGYLDDFDIKYEDEGEEDTIFSEESREGYGAADEYGYDDDMADYEEAYETEDEVDSILGKSSRREILSAERREMDEEEREEEKETRQVAMTSSLDWRYVTGPGSQQEAEGKIEGVKRNVSMLARLRDDVARDVALKYFEDNYSQLFNPWDFDVKMGMSGIRSIDMITWRLRVENGLSYWDWDQEDSFGELVGTLVTAPEARISEQEARALLEARDFMIRLRTAVNIVWERRGGDKDEKDILTEADASEVAKLIGMSVKRMSAETVRHRKNVQAIGGTFMDYETFKDEKGKERARMVLAATDRELLAETDLDLVPSGTRKGSRGSEGLPNGRYTAELRAAINTGNILPIDFDGITARPAQTFYHEVRGEIPLLELNYEFGEEDAASLAEGIRGLPIMDRALLDSTQIIFFKGERDAHYSLSRAQIYINLKHMRNPRELTRLIRHELQERWYVTVQMDLFDADWRAKRGQQEIEDKINEFAEKKHEELLERESGGAGWFVSTGRALARLWNALPRMREIRKLGYSAGAVYSRKVKAYADQGRDRVLMPNYAHAAAFESEVIGLAQIYGFEKDRQEDLRGVVHELVYNMIEHGEGGAFGMRLLTENGKVTGIAVVGWDSGAGIRDPEAVRAYSKEKLQEYGQGFGFSTLTRDTDTLVIESMGMRWEKDVTNRFRRAGSSIVNTGTRVSAVVYKKASEEKAVWAEGMGSFRAVMEGDSGGEEKEVTIVGRIPGAEGKQQRIESMLPVSVIDSSEGFNVAVINGVNDADGNPKKFVLKHAVDGTILNRYPAVSSLRKNAERTLFARGLLELLLREQFPEKNITLPETRVINVVTDGLPQRLIATEYVEGGEAVTQVHRYKRERDSALYGDILDVYFSLLMYWQDPQYIVKEGELVPFDMETVLSPLYYEGDHSYNAYSSSLGFDALDRDACMEAARRMRDFVRGNRDKIMGLIEETGLADEGEVSFGGELHESVSAMRIMSFLERQAEQIIDNLEVTLSAGKRPIADVPAVTEETVEAESEDAPGQKEVEIKHFQAEPSGDTHITVVGRHPVDMPAVSLGAAAPGVGTEDGEDAAPSAGEAVGGVKDKEDEELMNTIRTADPSSLAYMAAYLEMSGRRAHEMLGAVRQNVERKTLIMSLTQEQMDEEMAKVRNTEAATKRAIRKKFVVDNIKVVYYLRGDAESFVEAVNLAAEDPAFMEDAEAGMMAFVDRGIFDAADRDAAGSARAALDVLAGHGKNKGIVKENMEASQRQDVTLHVVLGVGLVDYVRTGRADLLTGIKGLLSVMVENEDEIMALTPEEVLDKLLKGGLMLRIRKIDYTEIDEWKAAQDAVTQSL